MIKRKLRNSFIFFARKAHRRISKDQKKSVVVISHAIVPGGLGDQAMLQSSIDYLERNGTKVYVLFKDKEKEIELRSPVEQILLHSKQFLNIIRLFKCLTKVDHIYITGADVFDGNYHGSSVWVPFLTECAATGIPVTILGFSFSERPAKLAVKQIRNTSGIEFCCRDNESKRRFEQKTFKSCKLTADVAFLLSPSIDGCRHVEIMRWLNESSKSGLKVFGVNISNHAFQGINGAGEKVSKVLSSIMQKNSNIRILFISHDDRKNMGDLELLNDVVNALSIEDRQRVRLITGAHAWEIKQLCKCLSFLLTGRMHLAIAALDSSVPVLAFGYQDKFEGLMDHFNIQNAVLDAKIVDNHHGFEKCLTQFLERTPLNHEILGKRALEVRALAEQNFASRN